MDEPQLFEAAIDDILTDVAEGRRDDRSSDRGAEHGASATRRRAEATSCQRLRAGMLVEWPSATLLHGTCTARNPSPHHSNRDQYGLHRACNCPRRIPM